mgnify:CR=1 FL=1
MELYKDTSYSFVIRLYSNVDGVTPTAGVVPTLKLSKNGAAFAAADAGSSISELANGEYTVTLSTTATNSLGILKILVEGAGVLDHEEEFHIIESPATPADVQSAVAVGAPTITVIPGVDVDA